ncbi:hypothetical protein ASPCAL07643 [Aspergillus calidoustus]|uniref:Aminotransferase class I/classII large domain-containing protein n=1 Tax=Aspergillus calidoustus TaxID=454130 RepID=A0A0U5CPC5_ASPCI|nr:hypothetical protein ASPCAL07643 [Aspergillus calidoustus]
MDLDNVSEDMGAKLQAILPALGAPHGGSSTDGVPPVDLSIAENELFRDEQLGLIKEAIVDNLQLKDLAYPAGFGGEPELLTSLARFFNQYFRPSTAVDPSHIVATSGAGNALDALLCAVCNEGDKVLVAGPCWEGFAPYFRIHANVTPICVTASSLEAATGMEIVEAITAAYHADLYPERIRAVVLTNPNNPLGRCYAPEALRECLWFCHAHDLHFISDEVYALSAFRTDPGSPPFTSALSLLDGEAGSDTSRVPPTMASRVHVVWSLSKDFGCSGVRLGCIVTQANGALRLGAGLASYWQVSSLASRLGTTLLGLPQLPELVWRNSKALGESYRLLTEGLEQVGIEYIPATHGLFILAKIIPGGCTVQMETAAVRSLASMGLVVAQGQRFSPGVGQCGWIRITFATGAEKIQRALAVLARFRYA